MWGLSNKHPSSEDVFQFGSNRRLTICSYVYEGKSELRRKHHQHKSHALFVVSMLFSSLRCV